MQDRAPTPFSLRWSAGCGPSAILSHLRAGHKRKVSGTPKRSGTLPRTADHSIHPGPRASRNSSGIPPCVDWAFAVGERRGQAATSPNCCAAKSSQSVTRTAITPAALTVGQLAKWPRKSLSRKDLAVCQPPMPTDKVANSTTTTTSRHRGNSKHSHLSALRVK